MAQMQGLQSVINALRSKAAKANKDSKSSVVVGFSASYAIYVHENLEAHHPIGQAKFLEQPAKQMKSELAEIVKSALRQGKTVSQSLLLAGLRLQRESMRLVPVDTGALKASAFVRYEK